MSLKFQEDLSPEEENRENTPKPPVGQPLLSIALILCYTAVFIAQFMTGFDRSVMLAGDDKDAFIHQQEFWRMLTGAALHGSIIHYAMNSYAFYSFGKTFEMLTNRWHVPVVFLLSAIGGAVLSLAINPHGISVGASGGIVGLVGYLAVYSFKRRDFITPEFRRSLIFNIGFILFYGFVLVRAVDNFAHIGGLVTGAVYALTQVPDDSHVDPRQATRGLETTGIVSLGIYGATCVFAVLLILQVI